MDDVPGPDDPRYWERLRRGPPLDEWVSPDAPLKAPRRRDNLIAKIAAGAGALALGAYIFWPQGDPTPPTCAAPSDTPCMVSDSTVRWIDSRNGQYQFESLSQWRQDRADAQQEMVDEVGGPPPGPGPYGGP